ncbi:MAG: aldehyde ferredoxin oxidoreductase family protein [Desulfobacterales bacterium]|nr:aldehyde ferredoxin oxidoreductase family protein [Desulfobacterales bacterium]
MSLYTGKILKVDLTTRQNEIIPLNQNWAEKFIGGKGLGFRYLIEELSPRTDPLSQENIIIFMTGPFAGTNIPSSSRTGIVTKSPATGTILDSHMGGTFAAELKFAGFDGIVISGRADHPVYLCICDQAIELKDASGVWGKGIYDSEALIEKELGNKKYKKALIGQAGENLIPFACIGTESYRQAGRGGAGAVMGSKNLKAVAVKGTGAVEVKDKKGFTRLYNEAYKEVLANEDNQWVMEEGTPFLVEPISEMGIIPVNNYTRGQLPDSHRISSKKVNKWTRHHRACFSCPLGCGKLTRTKTGMVEGPEYETLSVGGSNCGIERAEPIIRFNELCDDFGLDSISTGNVIGFAMEMTETGLHDFQIKFGQEDEYLKMPGEITCKKPGRGELLALGVKKLSDRVGGSEFAMEVKGLEFPGYDPRGAYGMGLAYATSDRGACHLRAFPAWDAGSYEIEPNVDVVVDQNQRFALKDSATICIFNHGFQVAEITGFLSAGTGKNFTEDEIYLAGERIWNLGRVFNIASGFSGKDDYLPERIHKEGLQNGPHKGKPFVKGDFAEMLRLYYEKRGWDENGVPTEETLERLGLLSVKDRFLNRGKQ